MGKPKNAKPAPDLDGSDNAGSEQGTKIRTELGELAVQSGTSISTTETADANGKDGSKEASPANNERADAVESVENSAVAAGPQAETEGLSEERDIGEGSIDDLTEFYDSCLVRFTVARLARNVATSAALFANGGDALTRGQQLKFREAQIMADFVRENPEAPVLAMYTHVCLQMGHNQAVPNPADMLALSLFHASCIAAHEFERRQAAQAAAENFARTPAGAWPGDLAMMPAENALSATGFTPQR